ncbi:xyloglucan endo-transglycosylase [Podospora fimiseda]|uniref:Xyloglucan endo-transglycosylase n=1 Tax=Podospora fimiseda TaxID=252190 RepID=A0AAN7BYJ5_9PEZI|nr:xyloglucan endo-transglycosylase [Podospora fimiseda]
MTNSPNNIFLSPSYLSLRTARLETFQTSAEIESTSSKFKYLSIRTLTRTIGSPGAITALFTYRHSSDPSQVQESDLEIRTSDPESLIHYTNQPSLTKDGEVESRATRNSTLPNGLKWSDWLIHRLDWTPEYTAWYVNDILVAQISFQVPRDESNIILNAWSDGGEWTGNMSVGGQAELQVKWIEIVYNSTEAEGGKIKMTSKAKKEKNEGGICGAVCGIDGTGVEEVGKPVLLWDNGGGERIRGSWGLLWVAVGLSVVLLA